MPALHIPNIGGELTAAFADGIATGMTSPALAALPDVAAPDIVHICVDPDGINGAPEWMQITAHVAGAETATVVRATENSTGRAHKIGMEWVHTLAPSELDNMGAIPVQAEPPANPAVDDLWFDTDEVSAGDAQKVLIEEVVLTAAAADITFSAIPGTYRGLMCQLVGRSDDAGALHGLIVTFNGDTALNYDYVIGDDLGDGTRYGTGVFNQGNINLGLVTAAGAPAGDPGVNIFHIPRYAGTTFHKVVFGQGYARSGTANTAHRRRGSTANWRSTAAITSITLDVTGNWIAGTTATLYGVI